MDIKVFAKQLDINKVVVMNINHLDSESVPSNLLTRQWVAVGMRAPDFLRALVSSPVISFEPSLESSSSSESIYHQIRNDNSELTQSLRALQASDGCNDTFVFLVKDASPDSIFSVFLLLVLAQEIGDLPIIETWINEILAWEQGRMPMVPERSWAAMASTLSHTIYKSSFTDDQMASALDEFFLIWKKPFGFLLESIAQEYEPANLPDLRHGYGFEASVSMRRLRQVYQECLAHSEILQLSLPVRISNYRRAVVDCLICVEHEHSDALKIFARNDVKASPSGQGFGLIFSYRPAAVAWNQYTFHSDPILGLDLTELWVLLERLETNEYRSAEDGRITRACGKVVGVGEHASYYQSDLQLTNQSAESARKLSGVRNCWVNPWFITADGSLIASPGRGADSVVLEPTRLTMAEVTRALWQKTMPFRDLQVKEIQPRLKDCDSKQKQKILGATGWYFARQMGKSVPVFRYLEWPRDDDSLLRTQRNTDLSPTAYRLIATISNQLGASKVAIADLVSSESYRKVALNGGFAVVAERGCTVVDDWGGVDLNKEQTLLAMQLASELSIHAAEQSVKLSSFSTELTKIGNTKSSPFDPSLQKYLLELTDARADQLKLSVEVARMQLSDDNSIRLFDEMVVFWRIDNRLRDVNEELGHLEDSVRALTDTRSSVAMKILGLWGIPILLGGKIAEWAVDWFFWSAGINGDVDQDGEISVLEIWLAEKMEAPLPIPSPILERLEAVATGGVFIFAALALYGVVRFWIRRQSSP